MNENEKSEGKENMEKYFDIYFCEVLNDLRKINKPIP